MMRTIFVGSLLVAAPSWALDFLSGCANPCGVEELVRGAAVTCAIGVNVGDADEPTIAQQIYYIVHHVDGDEIVMSPDTPRTLQPGETEQFPIQISANASDGNVLPLTAMKSCIALYPSGPVPFAESFPDQLTIVDQSTCSITTTTATSTSTSTSVTTTVPTLGLPRMKVCSHNGTPKKCP